MRSELEIYRAHDILTAIALEEVPAIVDDKKAILSALDVLCWVLEHEKTNEQNHAFADNLAKIEAELAARGFRLTRKNN